MPPALHFAVHPEHRLSTKSGPRAGPPLQPGESPAAPLGPTLITDRVFTLTLVGDGAPLAPTSHLCRRVASCSALCRAPRTPSFHQVVAPCRAPTAAGREPRSPPRPHFNNGPGLHANARGGRSAAGPHEPPLRRVPPALHFAVHPEHRLSTKSGPRAGPPLQPGESPAAPLGPTLITDRVFTLTLVGDGAPLAPTSHLCRRVPPALHFAVHPEHRLSTKSWPRAGPPLQPGESPAAPLGPTLITDRVFTLTLVGDGAPLAPTSHLSDECLLLCTLPCTQNTVFPPSRGPVPGPHCSRARAPQPPSAPL